MGAMKRCLDGYGTRDKGMDSGSGAGMTEGEAG